MDSLQLYTYQTPASVFTFSTKRGGGCSVGNYASFNMNPYCGDNPAHVRENTAMVCQTLDLAPDRLVFPHQTHGAEIAYVDEAFLRLADAEREVRLDGVDGLITTAHRVCVGVSTADCVPLLMYDMRGDAVAAVHAGWRGTVQKIGALAVHRMSDLLGCAPSSLAVHIGPSISLDAFEVGDEVYEAFAAAGFPMSSVAKKFPAGKWHIDLWEANRWSLIEAGVAAEHIQVSGICTYRQIDDFFSARRLSINSGRIFSGIFRK